MLLAAEKREDEVLDMLPGCFSALRVRDLPGGVVLGPLHSPISLLLHRMAHSLPRAAAVAVNTVHHLDSAILNHLQQHANFRSCLPVGPLSLLSPPAPKTDAAHQCLAWLDCFSHTPASVAYVSFGSFMTPPPAELAALAAGLEASTVPFIWSLKEKAWEGLPSGFRSRMEGQGQGLLVPWAPQVELLSHAAVGVFVTHCGWNSVMESISGGVPMICRPFFGDQKLNGRLVSEVWKIGVGMEGGLAEDGVAAAVDLVLRKEEGRGMRERAGALREAAKNAVGDGGSSRAGVHALLKIITPA